MTQRLPAPPFNYDAAVFARMVQTLQNELDAINRVAATGYLAQNHSTERQFDASTADLNAVKDVLGTLISDLKSRGILG